MRRTQPRLCRPQNRENQSPVDLHDAHAHSKNSLDLIRHQATHFKIENNGHTLQPTPLKEQTQITIDGTVFELKQFHFHTPSEHTFRGKHFAMEAHFVHQSAKGELAVLSTMFKVGAENPALVPLTAKMLKAGESVEQVIYPAELFPKKTAHFRLNGSLTTPPCSEGVHWIVYKNPVTASTAQIAAMKAIIGQDNNRPVQPINSRVVIEDK